MKTMIITAKAALLGVMLFASQISPAQSSEQAEKQQYHIRIVKENNGDKQVIDKTFTSKEEMQGFIAENNLEMPEMPSLPQGADKSNGNDPTKKPAKKERTIIIIDRDESKQGGGTELKIDATGLSDQEWAAEVQDLLDKKLGKLQVLNQVETIKIEKGNTAEDKSNHPPAGYESINSQPGGNLGDVKVYPNPSSGQFHVEFSVSKPQDVKLRITDMDGKEVYAYALSNYSGKFEKDIQAEGFSKGTYIVNIEAGGEKRTTQVVMQ